MTDKIEVPEIEYSVLLKFADDKRCNFKELCDAVREAVESPLRLRAELLSEAAQPAQSTTGKIEVPAGFVEWMKREIPPGTVISDPEWWAPRIYRALIREAGEPVQGQPSSGEFSGTPPPCCYECATPIQRVSWMIVCPHCGNKRCPRAENHRNACTGSNEPNQTATPCCNNPAQCWEPCGDLGKSAEHARPADEELRRDALRLAANRMRRLALELMPGSEQRAEATEWADEIDAAIAAEREGGR